VASHLAMDPRKVQLRWKGRTTSIGAYPVPAVMSGSTSSGRGSNGETDVMGQRLGVKARPAAPTAIGCLQSGLRGEDATA
jgi:hypothetical protein